MELKAAQTVEGIERDSLSKINVDEIAFRIQIGERVVKEAIDEGIESKKIQEVLRQLGVLKAVLTDRQSQIVPLAKRPKPKGINIGLKPVKLFARSG